MKKTLKLAGLLLALVMVISALPIMASADDSYTITVTNPIEGKTYSAYKVFDIESYTPATTEPAAAATATYKVNDDFAGLFATGADGLTYFAVDEDGYVTAKDGVDMAAFAKIALAYAKTNADVAASDTAAEDATSVVLDVTAAGAGYYLVDSTTGSLCALNSTVPAAEVSEKNAEPTVSKTVEDAEATSANVGDTVDYKVVITAEPGAENYVFHDVMETGLSYNNDIAITVGGTALANTNYDLTTASGDTITVTFTKAYLDTIAAETQITITYSAKITADAITDADGKLDNKATLDYGDNHSTTTDIAPVTSFGFDAAKIDATTKKVISGANFSLYTSETGGTALSLFYDETNKCYRPAANDTEAASTVTTFDLTVAKFDGLAAGDYYLNENTQPNGYNKLSARVKVTIGGTNGDNFFTANAPTAVGSDTTSTADGVLIANEQGTLLPTTGGIGTTIFYVIGAILVVGAGVLLVSKKRMAAK